MKRLIVICGVNHSKTSLLMDRLIRSDDDRLYFGKMEDNVTKETNYKKHEHEIFSNACKILLSIEESKEKTGLEMLEIFFKSLPNKITIVKYPKSIFLLKYLYELSAKYEIQIVPIFVLRSIIQVIKSTTEKLSMEYEDVYKVINYYDASLMESFKYTDIFYCPVTYFEKEINKKLLNLIFDEGK